MQRVVFIVYHGMGHFNACFKMARILQRDYEVHFAGVEFFKRYVSAQGFPYHPLKSVPFGMGFEYWVNSLKKKKNIFLSSLRDRYRDTLYFHREQELHALLDALSPAAVLIDAFQVSDFIVLYPYLKDKPIKLALVHITLPTVIHWNCPPINTLLLPSQKTMSKISAAWFLFIRILKSMATKIKYFGPDNSYIINRRRKNNNVPDRYFSRKAALVEPVLQHITEFIFSTREFDFKENMVSPFQHYVGYMVDKNRINIADEKYLHFIPAFKERLSTHKRPVIYCSFGTVKSKQRLSVERFIKRLIQVCAKNDYTLIVSGGGQAMDIKHASPDIYFFQNVPQPEVLSVSDVFITHGGLNSVKEAILAEVPMLVYIVNSYQDQKGNSSRILFHQIGLRGNLKNDTDQDISANLSELLHNPLYKSKLKELKAADAHYTPERLIKLFNKEVKTIL